jgi:C-terminal processing protease CtpA/Prc
MSDDEKEMSIFYNNILKHKSKAIKAIVIDIRDNMGGNDQCWESLLGHIFSDTLLYHHCLLMNDHEPVRKRYQMTSEYKDYGFATYRVLEEEMASFAPQPVNLGYTGTIYVLRNENIFSSANAFASFATKTDKIKTIGTPTGCIGGRGTTPNIFLLPHSRFCFLLELALDASYVTTAEEFYHDYINYPINPSMNYYNWYNNLNISKKVKINNRYKYDEFFLKAVEIIKDNK